MHKHCTLSVTQTKKKKERDRKAVQQCILHMLEWLVWYVSLAELLRESLLLRGDHFDKFPAKRSCHLNYQKDIWRIYPLKTVCGAQQKQTSALSVCKCAVLLNINALCAERRVHSGSSLRSKTFRAKQTPVCRTSSPRTGRLTDAVLFFFSWQTSPWF